MLYFATILPRDASRRTSKNQKAAKMNFLGMGPMEILVIAVVGLIIFGPGKLPEVAGQVGKAVRDFRRMTTELSSEFEKTAGLNEIKATVQKEIAGIQSEVTGVTAGVKTDLQRATTTTAKKPATNTSVKPAATTAAKTTAAKTSTSTAAKTTSAKSTMVTAKVVPVKASKSDPLADVSFLDDLPSTKPAPKPAAKVAAVVESEPAPEVSDALARARARRQTAGYNRAAHL